MKKPSHRRSYLLNLIHLMVILSFFLSGGWLLQAEGPNDPIVVESITWNVVGLDSNDVTDGPNEFPVAFRACNPATNTVTFSNVEADFVWLTGGTTTDDSIIRLRPGSLDPIQPSPGVDLAPGACYDFYFEVEIERTPAAYDQTRRYRVDISYDDPITAARETSSSETPREIYVEYLVSQNRNATVDVQLDGASIPVGGLMSMMVGQTYTITLSGNTSTNGYEQIESFIHFPNTIFLIHSVSTTYTADTSAYVDNPNDKLYGDSCLWENDPDNPNYRSCLDVGKNGGAVTIEYVIEIIGGAGASDTLNSLLYDFSGSSYHYNADFYSSSRVFEIVDPSSITIEKRFVPSTIAPGETSTLMFTVKNPTGSPVDDVNFTDTLPSGVVVASPANAVTSGCGTPTFTPLAGAAALSFSNGAIGPNSSCTIKVDVTAAAEGTYDNTTGELYLGTTSTGNTASDTLTVSTSSTGVCLPGQTLAHWVIPANSLINPPDLTGGLPTTIGANVSTATVAANLPASTNMITTSGYWDVFGFKSAGQYLDFVIDTASYSEVQMAFYVENNSVSSGPTQMIVAYDNGTGFTNIETTASPPAAMTLHTIDFTGLTSTTGNTVFRISASGSNNDNSGAGLFFDEIHFTGCLEPEPPPTLSKVFTLDQIFKDTQVSTLTFTISNTDPAATDLTGVTFTDVLPDGVQVASSPNASTDCSGSPTWAPSAGSSTLIFGSPSDATLAAGTTCSASVDVVAIASGSFYNASGFISSDQSGENQSSDGFATDTLTAVAPPIISKNFAYSTILTNTTVDLTFTIQNPNQSEPLTGVAFLDTLPVGLNVVAGSSTQCGGTLTLTDNDPLRDTIELTGGSLAGSSECSFVVTVTGTTVGTKNNVTDPVTSVEGGDGNTASSSIEVKAPAPQIKVLKQIGLTGNADGVWTKFESIDTLPQTVYYKFIVENTGDVALTSVRIEDDILPLTMGVGGNCVLYESSTPPVAFAEPLAAGDYVYCVVGPVSVSTVGSVTNTATAYGTYNSTEYHSDTSSAAYGTSGLSIAKSVDESYYLAAGDTLNYEYVVTNTGYVPLEGPVTVTDDKVSVTCPAVTTTGDLDNYLEPADYPAGSGSAAESLTCVATYTVTEADVTAQSITNTASASADGVTSDTDSVTIYLGPDLSITKDDGVTSVNAGESTTYTIVVTNQGPTSVTGAILRDPIAAGLSKTAVSCAATPGNCVTPPSVAELESGTFALPVLANGDTYAITVTADVTAITGDVTNTAYIDMPVGIEDPDTSNNSASDTDTVNEVADFSITKTDGIDTLEIGSSTTYTITVTNNGPSTVTGAILADAAATGLSKTAVSCAPAPGNCVTPPSIAQLEAGFALPSMASGETYVITVDAYVTAISGSVNNTATIAVPLDVIDGDSTNDSSTDTNTLNDVVAIAIEKTGVLDMTVVAPNTLPDVGDQINYTFTVTNTGNVTLSNVAISDIVPGVVISGGPIASLAPGAVDSSTFTAVYTLTQADLDAGTFTNTATVTGTPPVGDDATASDSDTKTLTQSASISLDKTGTLDLTVVPPTASAQAGDQINYVFTITNTGNVTLTNISVDDVIPGVNITGTIASLAPGDTDNSSITGSYTLTQTDIDAGTFTNTATVTGTPPVGDDVTDSNGDTQLITAAPSISLTKAGTLDDTVVAPSGVVNPGDQVNYTFTVTNTGNVTLTNVDISDVIPGVSISGGPIASLAPGAVDSTTFTAVYTLTQSDIDAGTFTNTATVTGTPPVGDDVTDSDPDTQTLAQSPSISLVKTGTLDDTVVAPSGTVNVGDQINYTFTVTNTGNVTLTNVDISDIVPGVVISGGPIASLAPGAVDSTTFTAVYTLTQSNVDAGTFTNTATVTGTPPVGDDVTDSDPDTQTLTQSPSISLVKTGTLDDTVVASSGTVNVGDQINYTFTVTNTGNVTLTNISISDIIPGVNISGTIASLVPGDSDNSTITGTYTLTQSDIDAGTFTNTATVTGTPPIGDDVTNSDDDTQTLTQTPSLSVVKNGTLDDTIVAPSGTVNVGDQVNYTFIVTNTGNVTLTSVDISDIVPGVVISGGPIASLAPGAIDSTTFTAVYTLTQADVDAGTFTNTATVTGTPPIGDNVSDSDPDTQTLTQSPSISLVKSGTLDDTVVAPSGAVNAGDQVNYTFIVTNTGNVTLTNVDISDAVPGVVISGGPIASLAPGAIDSTTFTAVYTLTQADLDAGTFTNTATVTGTPPIGDNVSDSDPDTQTLTQSPSISLVKSGTLDASVVSPSTDVNAGDQINYTFTIINTGNVTLTNVDVTDLIPGVVISGGPIASLAPGAVDTTTIIAAYTLTQADVDAGTFTNTATVTGTPPVGDDVTDSDTDTKDLSGLPSITLSKVGVLDDTVVSPSGEVNAGDQINYTFTITNTGNVTLTNVDITELVSGVVLSGSPIASLAPGAADSTTYTAVYTLTQADVDAGTFTNTATASGTPPAGDAVTDNDSDNKTFTQSPSISLVKTGTLDMTIISPTDVAQAGDQIDYVFTVTNTGNVTLTNISIDDVVAGVSISGTIASLAPGAVDNTSITGVYTLTQSDVDAGTFSNEATVTGTPPVGDDVTDSDGDTQTITAAPSISLSKVGTLDDTVVAPNGEVNAGDQINYIFTVTNTGNVTLTNVDLSDIVPGVVISGGLIASLAPGAVDSTTFTAVYTLTQADVDAGTFTNTATVTGTPPTGADVSDNDSDTKTFTAAPSISLTKTGTVDDTVIAPSGTVNAGDQINYTFTVTNTGNVTLTNVDISDVVPGVIISGGPIASLAPGAVDSTTFTAVYTLTQADLDAGTFTNTATVTGTPPTGDDVTDDDFDTKTFSGSASISLSKVGVLNDTVVSPSGVVNAGDQINYTFTITNTGNVTLTTVDVTELVSGVVLSGSPIASLAPGAVDSTTFTAVYTLTQADVDAGTFTNTASVTGTPPVGDDATDTDDDEQTLSQSPSISLDKTGTMDMTVVAPTGVAQVGDKINYVFTVTNTGNVTLTNISIDDVVAGVNITGTIASLAPGVSDNTSITGTYTLTQADVDAGTFANTATVTGTPPVGDDVTDSDGDTRTITAAPSISLDKSGTIDMTVVAPNTEVNEGDQINYTFTVTNTGNVTLNNISVSDTVGGVTINGTITSLAGGASDNTSITGTYTLTQSDIDSGGFHNEASVTGTDPNGTTVNNSDDDDQTLSPAPAIELSKVGTIDDTVVAPSGEVNAGDVVNYDFTITNIGNVTLSEIDLSDVVGGVTITGGPEIAELAPGDSDDTTFTGSYTLTQDDVDAGSFTNTAKTTGSDPNETEVSDEDDDTQTITSVPSIRLEKTGTINMDIVAPDTRADEGDTITYTFRVENTGNTTLYNVTVTDSTTGVVLSGSPIAELAPGAVDDTTYSATYTLTQDDIDAGSFLNEASVSAKDPEDTEVSDDDDDEQSLVDQGMLGIAKEVISGPTKVEAGTWQFTYQIYVENMGNVTLENIQVVDDLGAVFGTMVFSVLDVRSEDFTLNVDYDGVTDTDLLDESDVLLPGESGIIEIDVELIPENNGPFENTATAYGTNPSEEEIQDDSQDGDDPDPDEDEDPTNNNEPTPLEFEENIFDPPFGIKVFDNAGLPLLRWTMTWINDTNIVALNARVVDEIPSNSTFYDDGTDSGYALPAGPHPDGTTTSGVECTPEEGYSGTSTTTLYCYYEGPTLAYPRGRIIWEGTLGPDLGATDAIEATNEINISFHVRVNNIYANVFNTGEIGADLDGDGDIEGDEVVVADANAGWNALELPDTGFAPGEITRLPEQPAEKQYTEQGIVIEIPSLGIKTSIVTVPFEDGTWDVTWLGDAAGYLEGSAYPTWNGNTVLTAHNWTALNQPGLFVDISELSYGDQIIIHAFGMTYTYEVRSQRLVTPGNLGVVFQHEELDWVTLMTCDLFDVRTGEYRYRRIIRAVLVSVKN